jgi:hypothetical protein
MYRVGSESPHTKKKEDQIPNFTIVRRSAYRIVWCAWWGPVSNWGRWPWKRGRRPNLRAWNTLVPRYRRDVQVVCSVLKRGRNMPWSYTSKQTKIAYFHIIIINLIYIILSYIAVAATGTCSIAKSWAYSLRMMFRMGKLLRRAAMSVVLCAGGETQHSPLLQWGDASILAMSLRMARVRISVQWLKRFTWSHSFPPSPNLSLSLSEWKCHLLWEHANHRKLTIASSNPASNTWRSSAAVCSYPHHLTYSTLGGLLLCPIS